MTAGIVTDDRDPPSSPEGAAMPTSAGRPTDKLTADQAAAEIGVKPVTFRSYVSRGQAPAADGQLDGRTPFWYRRTVDEFRDNRPGSGARTDLGN